ncbi:hypothetical protein, partial [Enterobacter hormaechei]|uniref:phage tail tip protein J-related protein n=1 Tax=Enterobacter hormaechei TaxID=158836 RepID=UPI001D02AD36
FELYIYSADGKLVSQYETDQFRYEFYGLAAGSYTLGVRGRNENGMKGAETQVSLIIGAPKAPNSVHLDVYKRQLLTPFSGYLAHFRPL